MSSSFQQHLLHTHTHTHTHNVNGRFKKKNWKNEKQKELQIKKVQCSRESYIKVNRAVKKKRSTLSSESGTKKNKGNKRKEKTKLGSRNTIFLHRLNNPAPSPPPSSSAQKFPYFASLKKNKKKNLIGT